MRGEIVVQPIRPCRHQRLQEPRAARIPCFERIRADVELHPKILPDRGLAHEFRGTSHCRDVVALDAIEIVFRLRVDRTEHGVAIGVAVDVRDAPRVADDRDVLCLPLPAREVVLRVQRPKGEGEAEPNRQAE